MAIFRDLTDTDAARSEPRTARSEPLARRRAHLLEELTGRLGDGVTGAGGERVGRFGANDFRPRRRLRGGSAAAEANDYWAGIVTNGSLSGAPVSASVKKNMTAVSARFVCQSLLLTQNQWPR